MSEPTCPKCRAPVPAAHEVRTEWALCPRCGEVLDTGPAEPPSPEFRKRAPYDPTAERRRFRRALACAAGAVLAAVLVGGAIVWGTAFAPGFAVHASPAGDFSVALPGAPDWTDPGDNLTSRMYGRDVSVGAEHRYGFGRSELFVVNSSSDRAVFGPHNAEVLPDLVLDRVTARPPHPGAPPRRVPVPDGIAAEGEFRDSRTGARTALRLVVVNWRQFYLRVTGPDVGLNDRRVQRFFDSFRYTGPAPR